MEQYEIQISERAIGYVNTDVCMSVGEQSCCLDGMSQGPILLPAASPTLGGLYKDAVKDVTSPENDEESYYDYWSRWSGQEGNFTPEVAFNTYHMGSEGRLYSSKSTNGGKGLQNSKINSYFTP